jgi:hypothetical protein
MTAEKRYLRMLEDCDAKHATGPEAPCERCGVAAIRAAEDEATVVALEGAEQEALWCAEDAKGVEREAYRYVARRIRRLIDVERALRFGRTPGGGER